MCFSQCCLCASILAEGGGSSEINSGGKQCSITVMLINFIKLRLVCKILKRY